MADLRSTSYSMSHFDDACTHAQCRRSPQHKLYKIHNISDEEATLLEPAACAVHGLDKLNPPVGTECLLIGATLEIGETSTGGLSVSVRLPGNPTRDDAVRDVLPEKVTA